jgi:hypothetical protein
MDFIERWFGLSPDGSVELMILAASAVAVICLAVACIPALRTRVFRALGSRRGLGTDKPRS